MKTVNFLFLTVSLLAQNCLALNLTPDFLKFRASNTALSLDDYFEIKSSSSSFRLITFISNRQNLTAFMSCNPESLHISPHKVLTIRLHLGTTKSFDSNFANQNPTLVKSYETQQDCEQALLGLTTQAKQGLQATVDLTTFNLK